MKQEIEILIPVAFLLVLHLPGSDLSDMVFTAATPVVKLHSAVSLLMRSQVTASQQTCVSVSVSLTVFSHRAIPVRIALSQRQEIACGLAVRFLYLTGIPTPCDGIPTSVRNAELSLTRTNLVDTCFSPFLSRCGAPPRQMPP